MSRRTAARLRVLWVLCAPVAGVAGDGIQLPTGQTITPTAAPGAIFQSLNPTNPTAPDLRAGQATAVSLSPDGATLAILTSGFNRFSPTSGDIPLAGQLYSPALSVEYVFLFDVSKPEPKLAQVVNLPTSFQGLAWDASSDRLFVSGGADDVVLEYVRQGDRFTAGRRFPLKHQAGLGLDVRPMAAGLAVSPDGTRLLVTNLENDSVSLIDLETGTLVAEQDLRPGMIDPKHQGEPGGSFPRAVAWSGVDHAYVASERDREILSLAVSPRGIKVERRLPVHGQPVALLTNRSGTRLFVALDTTGRLEVLDTTQDAWLEDLDVTAPGRYANTKALGGANSNALALTPDENTVLISNGGENAVAVVRLSDRSRGVPVIQAGRRTEDADDDDDRGQEGDHSTFLGLVPTGWYPTGVAVSKDGTRWYVVNGKSPSGPNISWCQELDPVKHTCIAHNPRGVAHGVNNGFVNLASHNQFVWQLENAGFLTLPAPSALELARLTEQVARNNHFDHANESAKDRRLFSFLRSHIHHVIYIIKENRSYDQVLGDLKIGNGDRRLTLFPEANAPNHHAIARHFVTLDNFLVSGEVSWSGWDWAVSAQTNDYREHQEPLAMAHRGLEGEDTGLNRHINLGYATNAERHAERPESPIDPDILPSERDVTSPDGPGGVEGKGHLWDLALARGVTVRNWGFFGENRADHVKNAPLLREPYAEKTQVFFATKSALRPVSDPYYYDFGPAYPDFWRVKEWRREFAQFVERGAAPQLMLVRLGNDHFGSFDRAIDAVNTPETQMADNDYALGLIVQAVAESPFAKDTLIVSIEDDACDGPDHVDAHRSIALFAGPYVRQRALVSKRYTTVSVVKTIEQILGLGPIGIHDALAEPMSEAFDPAKSKWSYRAIVPDVLRSTQLPLPPSNQGRITYPKHSGAYWAKLMAGQDFSRADRIEPSTFNRALWLGLKGVEPKADTPTRTDQADHLGAPGAIQVPDRFDE